MSLKHITTISEHDEVLKGNKPVVLQFSASWCGPCKMITPKVKAMSESEEYKNINFRYIDIDESNENRELASKYNITSVPTFRMTKDGKEFNTLLGADVQKLKAAITDLKQCI